MLRILKKLIILFSMNKSYLPYMLLNYKKTNYIVALKLYSFQLTKLYFYLYRCTSLIKLDMDNPSTPIISFHCPFHTSLLKNYEFIICDLQTSVQTIHGIRITLLCVPFSFFGSIINKAVLVLTKINIILMLILMFIYAFC